MGINLSIMQEEAGLLEVEIGREDALGEGVDHGTRLGEACRGMIYVASLARSVYSAGNHFLRGQTLWLKGHPTTVALFAEPYVCFLLDRFGSSGPCASRPLAQASCSRE